MRICSPQLGLSPQSILGGEIYDREILHYLAKYGIECEIILPLGKPHPQVPGWRITSLPVPFVYPPHIFNFLVLPQLFSLFRQRPFQILRIHSPAFLGVAAAIFKKVYPQIPIVGTYHWLGEGGSFENFLDPYLMQVFDLIICDSFYTKNQIEKKFQVNSDKIAAIHNGVDSILKPAPKSKTLLKKYNLDEATTTLLFMGLFIERKNPQFLLSIISQLRDLGLKVKLLLCGKGPLEPDLELQIRQQGLTEYVQLVPPVFGLAKKELFNTVDVFVHPAKNEGFSLAVVEAMACGLTVVISDGFSAQEAVVDGSNGFLCKTQNDWVTNLITLTKQPRLRQTMRQFALEKVRSEFSWTKAVQKQVKLFHELIAQKNKE